MTIKNPREYDIVGITGSRVGTLAKVTPKYFMDVSGVKYLRDYVGGAYSIVKKGSIQPGNKQGWHEAPDHTGKAPDHVRASTQLSFNDILREPMQKQGSFEQYISELIQKATTKDPKRLAHGDTKYNAFWIEGNEIYPNNEWKRAMAGKGVISVHSHSPDNYQYLDDPSWKPDVAAEAKKLDPINFADMFALQHMIKYGYGDTIVVISVYGEYEYVRYTEKTNPAFLRLSKKKLYSYDQIPYERQVEYINQTGKTQKDMCRENLKDFCNSYGLIYKTGLRWR